MIRLIYVSTTTRQLGDNEMVDILEVARKTNKLIDISGVLLRKGDQFFQILEGDEDKVNELYHRICKDPRHKDCELLSTKPIENRGFADWEMGFLSLDGNNLSSLEGYSEVMKEDYHFGNSFRDLESHEQIISLFKELGSNFNTKMIKIALK